MKNPLSVAIIGTGNIAGGYDAKKQGGDTGIYTHAGAFAAHGGFELKTVFDLDRERAEGFSRLWKAGKAATDLDEIYDSHHDVVSVCTPDHTHFEIVRNILSAGCCRTIFVEKPLATELSQIEELMRLAEQSNVRVVVNFQRRNEPVHREIRDRIASNPGELLSVAGHYMKGLRHIGITMIDTLAYLCGYPTAVQAYNRVFNQEVDDFSYEFILYYPGFTGAVKTTDAARYFYNYHIFEIDLLFADRRLVLVDNSQRVREIPVTGYAYSGVKVLNEREAQHRETGYKLSMRDAVEYIYDITTLKIAHTVNTPQSSYNNLFVINHIIESYEQGAVKLNLEPELWKK
ncbi:MAG TPA: Gfo/Idh/MocA family oxidoreductase [Sideroxyarcus sp.]|nr:Gfo/Idh/MocA family oxidoreductase [Sideroxyarcus sp.]